MSEESKTFTQAEIEAIANALGHTDEGLKGTEIGYLLATARIDDVDPTLAKRHRVHNALVNIQNKRQHRRNILEFIRNAMKPERFLSEPHRFEPMRVRLNQALLFAGMAVSASGKLEAAERAETLSDARRRAQELRSDLTSRGVHPDVLKFCREELLADDYFHAVLEAVKSVADKIRQRTGLTEDGSALVDRAFGGNPPMIAINPLQTESQLSEQKGFANLLRGTFGMFRNTTAHAARIHWPMAKSDAEDLLSLVSLIHRRIDAS